MNDHDSVLNPLRPAPRCPASVTSANGSLQLYRCITFTGGRCKSNSLSFTVKQWEEPEHYIPTNHSPCKTNNDATGEFMMTIFSCKQCTVPDQSPNCWRRHHKQHDYSTCKYHSLC